MSFDKDPFDELSCDILWKLRCLFYDFSLIIDASRL